MTGTYHDHCWHRSGEYMAVNPPRWIIQCCHCGATSDERDKEHGDAKGYVGDGLVRDFPIRSREQVAP